MIRWGILGVGVAGQARARAIRDDPRAVAGMGYRGAPTSVGFQSASSAAEVIAGSDAVAVCAPDAHHPELVEAALLAGCHVLCEFPLAPTAAEARRLLALAARSGRVLHVEHIELLGGAARFWRARQPQILSGRLSFTSSRSGTPPALGNLARLHRIIDAVGLPTALRVDCRGPGVLQGALRFGRAEVALDFRFAADLPRVTELTLQTAEATLSQHNRAVTVDGQPVPLDPVGGLFLADQLHASARILDGTPPYLSDERLVAALSLVEALDLSPLHDWVGV
jgi:hypothetical protein